MRVSYCPRTEYDRGPMIRCPQWLHVAGRWVLFVRVPFMGVLFVHTPLEVR